MDYDYTRNDGEVQVGQRDEALLKRIRDRYRYGLDAWRERRDEGNTDMRYLSGDPWEPEDKRARKDAGRPAINHDELNQYVNQAANGVRSQPRGIDIEPAGYGADDKLAEFKQNLVRGIEYRSSAQRLAYQPAYESMLSRSYGFFRIGRKYVHEDVSEETLAQGDFDPFEQEIAIKGIPNPNSVVFDPDYKEVDGSDARWAFVVEPMPVDEFKRQYPNAKRQDFGSEDYRTAPDWVKGKQIMVGEYWEVQSAGEITVYQLESGQLTTKLPEGARAIKQRTIHRKKVVQYITNGVEILEENPQPGTRLPIIIVPGKEMYVDEGGVTKRKMLSLVRLARDPQMSYAFLCSQEMEEAGMTPKTPFVGYKGQFESDKEAWELLTKIPRAYVEVDPIPDAANGQILSLPTRPQFVPNFQQYELAKESARRAIMSAMGISPLPTSAQRQNEKSGVALQRIQQQQAMGAFHFPDSLDRSLELAGKIIDEWLPVIYDTERDVVIRKPDEKLEMTRVNTPQPYADPRTGKTYQFNLGKPGKYDVTVKAAPSFESQREEASEFLDTLIANLKNLPIPPPAGAKLLARAVKGKQLGPMGDEMAEIIDPELGAEQQIPPQAQAALQKAQAELQMIQAVAQELQQKLDELQREKEGKIVDNEYRERIEKLKIEAQVTIAEINTKFQETMARMKFEQDVWRQTNSQGHEAVMQDREQEYEAEMAERAAEQQQMMAQQNQGSSPAGA